jgi:hypothetical protein
MASFSPIRDIIDKAINLDLANPNLAISTKEALLKEDAITLGTLDYYRSFPLRVVYCTTYNSSGGSKTSFDWAGLDTPMLDNGAMYIPFEKFFTGGTPKVPQSQIKNAYFLGVIRIERPYWSNYSNPSMWEKQMFGFQVSGSNSYSNYNIMDTILSNTLDDLSTGQPRCWINRMENRVEVQAPWGFGQMALDAAIGFNSPEYVEMSKVDWLCKFISKRFIEAIIQARDGVSFDADFNISTEHLQKRLEKLTEQVESIQNHSVLHQAQWS